MTPQKVHAHPATLSIHSALNATMKGLVSNVLTITLLIPKASATIVSPTAAHVSLNRPALPVIQDSSYKP